MNLECPGIRLRIINCTNVHPHLNVFLFLLDVSRQTLLPQFLVSNVHGLLRRHPDFLTMLDGWTCVIHLSSLIEILVLSSLRCLQFCLYLPSSEGQGKKSASSLSSVLSFCVTKRFVLLSLLKLKFKFTLFSFLCSLPVTCSLHNF